MTPRRTPVDAPGTAPARRRAAPGVRRPPDPWAFAVEADAVQVTWRALPPGPVRLEADGQRVQGVADGGPGALDLDGLAAGRELALAVTDAAGRTHRLDVATPPALPGAERFRFATLSDLHLASRTFGFWGTIQEPVHGHRSSSERATHAAVAEAVAWGAQLLVLKGDLTNRATAEDWDAVGRVLEACPVPVVALPGNHDTKGSRLGALDADEQLSALGVPVARPVLVHDVPGLRIVLADTSRAGVDRGRLHHVSDLVLGAVAGAGPALVATHHHLQPLPVPVSWPPGIGSHRGAPFLARLAEVNPATLVTSGHTHRNRRRHVGPVVTTEVGSPKDFPGVWGGYVVHDAGIRQVVRRVADPGVLAWTDRTGDAAAHLWARWSPGPIEHRCFTHRWPT